MLYKRSHDIEQRLARLLTMIAKEAGSAERLATKLGVSTVTVARGIAALRERGHAIKAVRRSDGWNYQLIARTKDIQ